MKEIANPKIRVYTEDYKIGKISFDQLNVDSVFVFLSIVIDSYFIWKHGKERQRN